MKFRPMGDELLYADGRTDMTNLIIAFRNFANAPKKLGQQRMPRSILAARAIGSPTFD